MLLKNNLSCAHFARTCRVKVGKQFLTGLSFGKQEVRDRLGHDIPFQLAFAKLTRIVVGRVIRDILLHNVGNA